MAVLQRRVRCPVRRTQEPDPPRERGWTASLRLLAGSNEGLLWALLDEWWLRATAREWAGQDAATANALALQDITERLARRAA